MWWSGVFRVLDLLADADLYERLFACLDLLGGLYRRYVLLSFEISVSYNFSDFHFLFLRFF